MRARARPATAASARPCTRPARAFVLLALLSLLLAACAGEQRGAPVRRDGRHPPGHPSPHAGTHAQRPATLRGATYTVAKGDTLYSIAFRAGLDVRALAAANDIPPPFTIYPGQRIHLRAQAPAPSGSTAGGTRPPAARPPASQAPVRAGAPAPVAAVPPPALAWPAPGRVVQRFGAGSKGVDIAGHVGEPVFAAADGEVVYAGNGLRGYGNLLILKHGETWLSAYGHNDRLLVREGDRVKARQKIAEIGTDGSGEARLHFEVRREGTPVDPLRVLPPR